MREPGGDVNADEEWKGESGLDHVGGRERRREEREEKWEEVGRSGKKWEDKKIRKEAIANNIRS